MHHAVFNNLTLTVMSQMVHIAWRAAAFANKDIVVGMNDLVSGKNSNIEPTLLCFWKSNADISHWWLNNSEKKYLPGPLAGRFLLLSIHVQYLLVSYIIFTVYHTTIFEGSQNNAMFSMKCLLLWGIWVFHFLSGFLHTCNRTSLFLNTYPLPKWRSMEGRF